MYGPQAGQHLLLAARLVPWLVIFACSRIYGTAPAAAGLDVQCDLPVGWLLVGGPQVACQVPLLWQQHGAGRQWWHSAHVRLRQLEQKEVQGSAHFRHCLHIG
jgi:hypothetical protein